MVKLALFIAAISSISLLLFPWILATSSSQGVQVQISTPSDFPSASHLADSLYPFHFSVPPAQLRCDGDAGPRDTSRQIQSSVPSRTLFPGAYTPSSHGLQERREVGLCPAASPRLSQHLLAHCLAPCASAGTQTWCALCDELRGPPQVPSTLWTEAVGFGKLHHVFLKKAGKTAPLPWHY